MKRLFRMLLSLCFFFSFVGCAEKVPAEPLPSEIQHWDTMPSLTYGVLESEALEILPWYSGRCETSSHYWLAETKDGYYWNYSNSVLCYADKTNIDTWVPVCSKPNCSHGFGGTCQAAFSYNTFFIRDGRIWFADKASKYPGLYQGKQAPVALLSRAADGSDLRLEYVLEDALNAPGDVVSYSMILTPEHFLYSQINMGQQGDYYGRCYRVTSEGIQILFDGAVASGTAVMRLWPHGGDVLFGCSLLEETSTDMCAVEDGKIIIRNTSDYMQVGKYLSGNILRCFRENYGYFDINLDTGEVALLSRNQLRGSNCKILLPNCIIESTLDYDAEDLEGEVTKHAMKLYDGKSWRDVHLPEEVKNANTYSYAVPVAITSDRIFFRVSLNGRSPEIYCIELGQEAPTLQYCGRIY